MKLPRLPEALSELSFLAYLGGHAVSTVGTWAQRVVLYWIAWETTQSTAVLGMLAAADLLPAVISAPFAGTLADRFDRRRLAIVLQLASIVPALAAMFALLLGQTSVPILVGISLATGILNGLDHPVRMVLVSDLVDKPRLSGAVTANSVIFNLGRMLGPALGGIAIAIGGSWTIFLLNALSYVAFALILTRLRSGKHRLDAPAQAQRIGWLNVLSHVTTTQKLILGYFAILALCIRPIFELLPAFANNLVASGAGELFAFMTSAQALGAALGGVAIGILLGSSAPKNAILVSSVAIIASATLFLMSQDWIMAIIALTLLSGSTVANGIACQVLLQTEVADGIRGKVMSIYTMLFRGMPALGAAIIGVIAETIPQQAIFWFALLVALLATVFIVLAVARRQ